MKEIEELGGDPRPIQTRIGRLFDLKTQLGTILDKLGKVNVINLEGANFESGMKKVYEAILSI